MANLDPDPSAVTVTALSLEHIEAVAALISRGEPFVRARTPSDYWLYATLFASTCPVALVDGAVVGVVIAMRSQEKPGDVYIQDVMIDPDHRRAGLATALLAHVHRRARTSGCTRLYLTSEPENRSAHAAWLSMGFRNVPGQELVDGIWITSDFKGPGKHRAVYELPITAAPATPDA